MKTVSFGNMTDYDAEAQQLADRKKYAEALRAQGQQAVPNGQMVGNHFVATHPLQHLANALRQYSGQRELQDVRAAEQGLAQRKQEDLANAIRTLPSATTTTEQQLVGDRPGAGSFEPVTKTQQPTPDAFFNWMAQNAHLGPQISQLGQMGYLGAIRGQERADDRTFRAETLKSEQAFREQQAAEARNQRIHELVLRLEDSRLSREQNADLRRELAQLAVAAKQAGGGAQPYFQAVSTPQGVMAFNARTGQMEPVRVGGQAVAKASDDPTLQGQIAGAKEGGKQRAKNEVEAQANLPGYVAEAENSIKLVDELLSHPGRESAVGLSSINPLNKVPGTAARDFEVRLEQIKGKQFLQAFESLKGGGQITEVEGQKATAAISRMNTAQSEKEFESAAKEFQSIIRSGVERAKRKASGGVPAPAADPDAPPPGAVRIKEPK